MTDKEKTTRGARTPAENPLLSKNIPPPPLPSTLPSVLLPTESKNENSGEELRGMHTEAATTAASEQTPTHTKKEEEHATIELSLYLRPAQDEKL